eukprot:m.29049 g.29049  ORF g.29049 m.29049 type:complete len:52 (+) comp31127_c0_seq1:126-281(+)
MGSSIKMVITLLLYSLQIYLKKTRYLSFPFQVLGGLPVAVGDDGWQRVTLS